MRSFGIAVVSLCSAVFLASCSIGGNDFSLNIPGLGVSVGSTGVAINASGALLSVGASGVQVNTSGATAISV